jgi:hypothetical protein
LRTDETVIRAQAAISGKSNPEPGLVLTKTGFIYGWIFIRA